MESYFKREPPNLKLATCPLIKEGLDKTRQTQSQVGLVNYATEINQAESLAQ